MSDYVNKIPLLPEHQSTTSYQPENFGIPSQNTSQYDMYKARLENFLLQRKAARKLNQPTHKPNSIKLSEVTNDMKKLLKTIRKLRYSRDQLKKNVENASADEWQKRCDLTSKQKTEITKILSKYENENVQEEIKNCISKRKNKRANIKKMKEKIKQNRRYEQLEREEKHKQIDLWLIENTQKISQQKQRTEDANRAEHILAGVTKKKLEAKKYLALFDSLVELRHVRQVQSGKSSASSTEFNQKITDLKRIWFDALHDYELEENELRKLLCVRSDQELYNEWCKVLFGPNSLDKNASRNNPVLKAQHSIKELIRVR